MALPKLAPITWPSDWAAAEQEMRRGPLPLASVVRRLFVFHGLSEAADAASERDHLLFEQRDGLLLLEHDLIEFAELTLQMSVADFEVDDAWVHGGQTLLVTQPARGFRDRSCGAGVFVPRG